jgi:hypothetical protein
MSDNKIVKILVNDYDEYINVVKGLEKEFACIDDYEVHFGMTPYPEDSPEFEDGKFQLDTVRHKPESYPCIYIIADFSTYNHFLDDFIYLRDFV